MNTSFYFFRFYKIIPAHKRYPSFFVIYLSKDIDSLPSWLIIDYGHGKGGLGGVIKEIHHFNARIKRYQYFNDLSRTNRLNKTIRSPRGMDGDTGNEEKDPLAILYNQIFLIGSKI